MPGISGYESGFRCNARRNNCRLSGNVSRKTSHRVVVNHILGLAFFMQQRQHAAASTTCPVSTSTLIFLERASAVRKWQESARTKVLVVCPPLCGVNASHLPKPIVASVLSKLPRHPGESGTVCHEIFAKLSRSPGSAPATPLHIPFSFPGVLCARRLARRPPDRRTQRLPRRQGYESTSRLGQPVTR